MRLGFFAASSPVWLKVLLIAIMFELVAGFQIRGNLALNVLLLVWPIDAVHVWQGG